MKGVKVNKQVAFFCEKAHESNECFQAKKINLTQKTDLLKNRGVLFVLKLGHRSKLCKANLKCVICDKKHHALMCPDLPVNQENLEIPVKKVAEESSSVSLANQDHTEVVLLQTLLVKLETNGCTRVVRALYDSGSQRSYILEKTVEEMGYQRIGSQKLEHVLFGGTKTKREVHHCFNVSVKSLDDSFSCVLQVLEQPKICGQIPRLKTGPWLNELKRKNIHVTDHGEGQPTIELLIGADYGGQLLTGNMQHFAGDLVAVETRLGWVVMGKMADKRRHSGLANMAISLLTHSNDISNLWKLDVIGITDPAEKRSDTELEATVMDHFKRTLVVNSDGRYEVTLPWIEDPAHLRNNKELAEKRLRSTTEKLALYSSNLLRDNKLEEYNAVFQEWLQEDVIEVVQEKDEENQCHYLPHRGVFKDNSTTRVRPVFDASCKQKGTYSLNDCLAKGPNLLELLPSVLTRFREGKIGVVSDIRRAFLQLAVNESDRDYLRFLWWELNNKHAVQTFRHKRVVFGVNCSPFLLGDVIDHHLEHCDPEVKDVAEKLKNRSRSTTVLHQ